MRLDCEINAKSQKEFQMDNSQDNLTICSQKQKEDIEKMIGIYKRIPDISA